MQNFFDRVFAKNVQLFFRKTCAIRFQKAKFFQNLTSVSGSKQRFSLLQEKAVIQAVCLTKNEMERWNPEREQNYGKKGTRTERSR